MQTKKPALMGALFDLKGDEIVTVATDSHRLAVVRTKIKEPIDGKKFIIPGTNLMKIGQILTDEEEKDVDMIVSDNYIMFDFGNYQIYSRLLEGEFLKYEVLLSAANAISLKTDRQAMTESLERANLIINDDSVSKTENKVPVRLNIAHGRIDISCRTARGYVNDIVPAEQDGGDLIIGFNCRFMLDALNACDDETVVMEFSAPTSGCFIRPADKSDRYTFMVLPVRL